MGGRNKSGATRSFRVYSCTSGGGGAMGQTANRERRGLFCISLSGLEKKICCYNSVSWLCELEKGWRTALNLTYSTGTASLASTRFLKLEIV
jgi:hypothetical protein